MTRFLFLCFALLALLPPPAAAEYFGDIKKKIWTLEAPNGHTRWLILRTQVKDAHGDLYHVEVLQRKDGDPEWKFERLAAHMAVTEKALRWSIGSTLNKGDVYPESFDDAYAMWKEERNPPICTTNIEDCLKSSTFTR
jgi:hypothetical protein